MRALAVVAALSLSALPSFAQDVCASNQVEFTQFFGGAWEAAYLGGVGQRIVLDTETWVTVWTETAQPDFHDPFLVSFQASGQDLAAIVSFTTIDFRRTFATVPISSPTILRFEDIPPEMPVPLSLGAFPGGSGCAEGDNPFQLVGNDDQDTSSTYFTLPINERDAYLVRLGEAGEVRSFFVFDLERMSSDN